MFNLHADLRRSSKSTESLACWHRKFKALAECERASPLIVPFERVEIVSCVLSQCKIFLHGMHLQDASLSSLSAHKYSAAPRLLAISAGPTWNVERALHDSNFEPGPNPGSKKLPASIKEMEIHWPEEPRVPPPGGKNNK